MPKKSKPARRLPAPPEKTRRTAALAGKTQRNSEVLAATARHLARTADQLHRGIDRVHHHTEDVHERERASAKVARAKKAAKPELFSVVGIGASAGGLEAVTQLLDHLPADSGLAFVLVQHLDPTHESALASLLGRTTKMPVSEARHHTKLEANHLYVTPPNKCLHLSHRRLKVTPRRGGANSSLTVIDDFLRSLAEQEGSRAIGVLLSGNGSDGTNGLLAIKAAGGVTLAQSEKTAKFPAMPGNAIAAGAVDFVLPPSELSRELQRMAQQGTAAAVVTSAPGSDGATDDPGFQKVLDWLRQRMGVDFTHYKHATLKRRIQRRLTLNKCETLQDYNNLLRRSETEVKELFNDILIHVTSFFRDRTVFQALRKKVLPRLLQRKRGDEPVRIWIAGCSTGEEVYSIAIALVELINQRKIHQPVQIFGTDINEAALRKARAGHYPECIHTEVSRDILRRFFSKAGSGYRVNKAIRELCIFARQNLVNDPPFSNLDLISCRNLLIYLSPTLQRRVLPVFHYALRPEGLLMLGASETIGGFSDLFALRDKQAKIYSKKAGTPRSAVSFGAYRSESVISHDRLPPAALETSPALAEIQKQADRIILASYSPAGVIINKRFEVLQFRGRTGLYLEHAHGEASLNLLKMAREGLIPALRDAVVRTVKQNVRSRREGVRIKQNGHSVQCHLEVVPFSVPPAPEKFYLVIFEPFALSPMKQKDAGSLDGKPATREAAEDGEVGQLREELSATRGSLQSVIQDQEATNEEFRSANEEIMSSNEELQSTNEELETAKEELQSTNEELTTLNEELEQRNAETAVVNSDLENLLASISLPVLILTLDLRIRRFTAAAGKFFKLIPGDIGRPISNLNLPLDIPPLDKFVPEVFESLTTKEIEARDKGGHWWNLRIRPYKNSDQKIDGAIITLVDMDVARKTLELANRAREFAEAVVNTIREPLLVLNQDLVVTAANQSFYRVFQVAEQETLDRRIYNLGNGQWKIPRLRTLLEKILPHNSHFQDFEVRHAFPHLGKKRMLLNARRLVLDSEEQLILLAIEEKDDA